MNKIFAEFWGGSYHFQLPGLTRNLIDTVVFEFDFGDLGSFPHLSPIDLLKVT